MIKPLSVGAVLLVIIALTTVPVAIVVLQEAGPVPNKVDGTLEVEVTCCKNTKLLAVIAVVEADWEVEVAVKNPDAALPKAAGVELLKASVVVKYVAAD